MLDPDVLQQVRSALVAEIEHLDGQIAALTRSFDDIVEAARSSNNDDEHDPDGATVAFERAQIISLLQQAQRDHKALGDALERLDAGGDYGICERCGNAIATERLLALPGTRRCVGCA